MTEAWSDLQPLSLDKMDAPCLSSDSALLTASLAGVDHLKDHDTQQKLLSELLPLFFQFMALFTALVIPVEHNSVHLTDLTSGTCFRTNRA